MPRYYVHDRFEHIASYMRPKSTTINPRYRIIDRETGLDVDEFTTKRPAIDTARDMNRDS